MMLDIQVLAWDRHKRVAGSNLLMELQSPLLITVLYLTITPDITFMCKYSVLNTF